MATACASVADISSVTRANSFTAQAESSEQTSFSSINSRFPRPGLVAAVIFPHAKWLPKTTDDRDAAALRVSSIFGYIFWLYFFDSFVDSEVIEGPP